MFEEDWVRDLVRLEKLDILFDWFFLLEEVLLEYVWNLNDRLVNIFVKDDDLYIFYWYFVV